MLIELGSRAPIVASSAWVAENAILSGDITVGDNVGVWFGAVCRGDGARIDIGATTNIQDGCVIHADPGLPARIGNGVTVGHRAVLHGCAVSDDVLIGIGAVVLNGASIGAGSVIAAGSVVLEGAEIAPRSLVAGVPAAVRRTTTDDELRGIQNNAAAYVALAQQYASACAKPTRPAADERRERTGPR
jgi:carbonic anhydrase/acetyltransferase-like protein (isoleucine patch superfamily)